MTKHKAPDEAVGYGKPPKSGQFKKGQSGNPRGRPKGSLYYKTHVKKMLSTRVTVTEDGKRKRVSSLQATLMRLCEKSLKGDMRAIEKVLSLAVEMAAELEVRKQNQSIDADEEDILERYKQDILAGGNQHRPLGGCDEQ